MALVGKEFLGDIVDHDLILCKQVLVYVMETIYLLSSTVATLDILNLFDLLAKLFSSDGCLDLVSLYLILKEGLLHDLIDVRRL
jgi:hypothetical protein